MQRTALPVLLLASFAAAYAGAAAAVNCYEIIDRNDNVVYRGTLPPIDLSDQGKPEREALRQRGQQLIAMDVDRCIGIEYFTGAAGSTNLTVDQIVGGIPMRGSPSIAGSGSSGTASAAPASTASSPPARSSGVSGGGTRYSR